MNSTHSAPAPALTLTLSADGWLQQAHRRPCPHQAARPPGAVISLVVVHGISLPPGEFGGDAVADLFGNTLDYDAHPFYDTLRELQVSAHFFIRRAGDILQFVSTEQSAWHAGASSWRGKSACNDFSIGIELEGCDHISYAEQQYQQLAALIEAIARRYPHIKVAGHCHIAPQRKTDPGAAFDWHLLFAQIGQHYDGRTA